MHGSFAKETYVCLLMNVRKICESSMDYRRSHVVRGNANVYTFIYSYSRIYVDHLMMLDVYENSYRPHLYIYMYIYRYVLGMCEREVGGWGRVPFSRI